MAAGAAVLGAATVHAAPATEAGPPAPVLSWGPCRNAAGQVVAGGFECATARVPLDYRKPRGRTISLAVTRRLAADPARRTGVLFLHPGGPGNSGVDFAQNSYANLPAALRDGFDVVGFDMRGVARSAPVECWNDREYSSAVDSAKGVPGPGALVRALREARDFDAACRERAGDLLPFIGTASNARDIDVLRAALGEDRISFYGRSFGTYVGTVYAASFPRRVRAMALDGGYDPIHYADEPYAYDAPQFTALDGAVGRFLDWCRQEPQVCGFGEGRPRQAFQQLKAALDADPVITASGRPATSYTLAYRLMFNINGGKAVWPDLGRALRLAQLRSNTSFLLSPPSPASFDFLNPNVAVECADRIYPRSLGLLRRNLTAEAASAPLLGPPVAYGPPTYDHNHAPACVQWPAERLSRFNGSYRAAGSPPILVVGTTGDPDTPYKDAIALSRILHKGRLLTFRAEGHTAFNRSACASAAITDYLATLAVPAAGTVCTDEKPVPGQPSADGTTGVDETQDLIPVLG
ncbi:alpha/beta fold hydrolase [Streptomyces sp. NPDC086023]|uniref:alpha/beta fold hydrolase n=1 Tax=Streptomyces sp. NPDC086023 TaxID=3365746 RepID=UPI0037D14592